MLEPLYTAEEMKRAEAGHDVDAAGILDEAAAAQRLGRAVEALPDTQREVVRLRYVEGLSYQQIADALRCPAGTVMSRLARARTLLRGAVVAEAKRPR